MPEKCIVKTGVIVEKIDTNFLVTKSNDLINALFELSVQEQRLVLILISLINPKEDENFKLYKIPIDLFKKAVGLSSAGYYTELDQLTTKLMQRVFTVKLKPKGFLKFNWLAFCQYKSGQGYIELEISEHMKPYLLDLKSHYTSYRLKNVLPLRSGYSIRLYELLKQYEAIRERYFEVGELRQILQISDKEYKLYADFKRKVILKAEKELPLKTDIAFTFKEKKGKGKKVEGIIFFIKRNNPAKNDTKTTDLLLLDNETVLESEALESITDTGLYMRLQEFGISQDQAKSLVHKYNVERLTANLDYAERKIKAGGVADVAAYTLTIIKNDARLQPNLFDQNRDKAQSARLQEQQEKERQEKIEHEYAEMRIQVVNEFLDTLDEQEKLEIEQGFAATLNAIIKPYYNEKGLESPIVKALYCDFIVSNHLPSPLPDLETFATGWTN